MRIEGARHDRGERAGVDLRGVDPVSHAIRSGVLPGQIRMQGREAVLHALQSAELVSGSARELDRQGMTAITRSAALDLGDGTSLPVITKEVGVDAHRELFAHEVADAFAIRHLLPPAAVRDDTLVSLRIDAQDASVHGIRDQASLDDALRAWHRNALPDLDDRSIARLARMEREAAQSFDYVLGIVDRHSRNVMFDPGTAEVHWIDHAALLRRSPGDEHGLRPLMTGTYLPPARGGVRSLELSSDTVGLLRSAIDPDSVRAVAQDAADAGHLPDTGAVEMIARRLDRVLETGRLESRHSRWWDLQAEGLHRVIEGRPALLRLHAAALPAMRRALF